MISLSLLTKGSCRYALSDGRAVHDGTGEGGIRTLGSLLGYGALAKRCFQPLSHLTKIVATACGPLRDAPQARGYRDKQRISLRIADCQHRPASCARDFIGVANCRLLIEMMAMISEEEAGKRIVETVRPLPVRKLPITKSLGCFAAEDHFARLPLPTFDNSAMDGYAVVASSCKKGQRLRVTGEQPAGVDRQLSISPGEAVRIFTGAPLPRGADAIVMQEDVTRDDAEIVVNTDVSVGEFVRRRGCDLSEGQKILATGEQIGAATLALLAS